jgi:hypothetical protein
MLAVKTASMFHFKEGSWRIAAQGRIPLLCEIGNRSNIVRTIISF